MKYPCNYDLLREEEMVYIAGGSALDAFNYLFGDWFRDMLLSDIRNATWGSMQQLNVQPVVDTGKRSLVGLGRHSWPMGTVSTVWR